MLKRILNAVLEKLDISVRQLYIMYLCVFLLPLILSLVLGNISIHQLEEQIRKTGHSMTRQVQAVIDSRMQDVTMILDQINNHSTIRYMLNRKSILSNSDRYKISTIVNDLRKQYANTCMLNDIYIYMTNTDSVISTVSWSNSEFFYNYYYSYEDIAYKQWLREYMLVEHDITVMPARNVFNGVSTNRMITVLQSLPRDSGQYYKGTAVLLIDEKWLLSQIMPDDAYDKKVFVFSSTGDLILSSAPRQEVPIDWSYMQGSDGSNTTIVDGVSTHISYVKSPTMGWTYVLAMPTDQFYMKVNELRSFTVVALAVVCAIGILMTALLAYVSFIPANSAIMAMENSAIRIGAQLHNSYSVSIRDIGTVVREALEDRNLYRQRLPLLIETYVYKLLNGSRDADSELSLVSEVLGFRFPTNTFAVISFSMDDAENKTVDLKKILSDISMLPDSGMDLYSARMPNDMISVLASFWGGDGGDYREMLYRSADRIMRGLERTLEHPIDIGISLVEDNYENINALYRQSMLCIAGSSALCPGRIVFYADIARLVPPGDYSYSLNEEKRLISYVCAGDSMRMEKLLNEIFMAHEKEARMIEGMTQCLKYDMIGTLFRCSQEIDGDEANEQADWNMIKQLMSLERPENVYGGMIKAFSKLCDRAYEHSHSHNDEMRDRIIKYIADNYNNPEMGLDMAARAFGLAPGYFSRFFKEQTGGNFLDHVNRLRIEHAAQLLRSTELSYSAIAEQCGLSSSQALNRLFNRVLGVSPTVYRKMAREGSFKIDE